MTGAHLRRRRSELLFKHGELYFMLRFRIQKRNPRLFAPVVLGIFLTGLWVSPAQAAKTDVVVLKNGDRITGEVKSLDRGRLRYSTDSMGTIYIEWDDVQTLVSDKYFRVELSSGRRYFGDLSDAGGRDTLTVAGARGSEAKPIMDFVRITPVEDTWRDRNDLKVGVGYSYDKGSDVTRAHVYADTEYVSERRVLTASLRSDATEDSGGSSVSNLATGQYKLLRDQRKYWFVLGQAQQNDELDIDLRLTLGTGLGKVFRQTNRRKWLAATGLAVAREESGDGTAETSLEGILQTTYESFLYDTPKLDLTVNLLVFPGISDFGRVRSNYDVTLSKEFVSDFFIDLTFGGSYDTDPSSDDASRSDYTITTGLSYEF
jgi:hypothetical protein